MKKLIAIFSMVVYCIFLSGCASRLATGLITEIGLSLTDTVVTSALKADQSKSSIPDIKTGELIERHAIGKNTVKISKGTFNNESGIFFIAYNANEKQIGDVFYEADNEDDMRDYNKFLKMNPAEKKQYIREDFIQYANVDLGPVEPVITATKPYTPTPNTDTQQTVLSNWDQPAETFVSPSGKVKILIYNKEYKGYQVAVLAFIGQKLHKIIPMTPENYQGFRTKLTGTQDIATLFGLSE